MEDNFFGMELKLTSYRWLNKSFKQIKSEAIFAQ